MDTKTILIIVGAWLLGYVLGLLEAWVKQRKKDHKKEFEQAAMPEVVPQQPASEPLPAPDLPAMPDAALSLFETSGNNLELKVDGEAVYNPGLLSPDQRKRIINLVVKLRPWLDAKAASAPKPAPAVRPMPASTPAKPVPIRTTDIPAATEIPTEERELVANLSMVEQIDRVLQRKLGGHPLHAKGIRLQETITGGVNFYVGLTHYEYLDEIPDPQIREIIQAAINEWENNATPG